MIHFVIIFHFSFFGVAVSLPVADTKKFGLCEDEDVQVAKSDVPSQKLQGPAVKCEEKKEDVPSQKVEGPSVKSKERKEVVPPNNNVTGQTERMDNEINMGNDLALTTSKEGIVDAVLSMKIAFSSEVHIKIETENGTTAFSLKGSTALSLKETTGVSLKADVLTTTHERKDDNVRESSEGKVWFLFCSDPSFLLSACHHYDKTETVEKSY